MEVPLQAPPQLANRASLAGEAVSVTAVPLATMTSQVDDDAPQSRPPPVTVPGPLTEADNRTCAGGGGCETKLADTAPSWLSDTMHSPLPLQSPPQPANVKPLLAVAVRVIEAPAVKFAEHVEESQLRPGGDDFTWPLPVTVTVSRRWSGGGSGALAKVALTSRLASRVRSHPPVPLHAPDQATNEAPESGTATRWTCVPTGSCVVQLPRQSAPTPRTRPFPVVLIFRLTCVEPPPPDPPFEFEPEDEPDPQLATRASVSEPAMSARMDGPRQGSLGIRSTSGKAVSVSGERVAGDQETGRGPGSSSIRPSAALLRADLRAAVLATNPVRTRRSGRPHVKRHVRI